MPDYSKGKIYIIENDLKLPVYIGSMILRLSQRTENTKKRKRENN